MAITRWYLWTLPPVSLHGGAYPGPLLALGRVHVFCAGWIRKEQKIFPESDP